jgi:signal transduction histidine kinase
MEMVDELLSAMPTFVMLVNAHRQVVYANRSLLAFLGVPASELIGKYPGEVWMCRHALEEGAMCGTTDFCRYCGADKALRGALAGRVCAEEYRVVRDAALDPPALDLRVLSTPLLLNDESYVLMAAEDITDEKRRQVLERTFFHDILNTATIIDGAVELMLSMEPGEDDTVVKDIIGRVSGRLINEIVMQRDLSEMENHTLEPTPDTVETRTFLEGLLLSYATHELAAGRLLELAPDSDEIEFVVDKALLGRVLGNLLKNAIEASQPGETISIGCSKVEMDRIEFWVQNSVVMPEHVRMQVFGRSFSTKGRGRGIGTYSVKLLTERYLEGTVSFTSRPSNGTIFRVRYPLTPTYAEGEAA